MTGHDMDDVDRGPSIEVEAGQRFALVPEWVLFAPGVSHAAVRVYAALACIWSDWTTGECWPSRDTVAQRLGVSTDTVDRAVKQLVEVGAVRVEARYRPDGSRASNKLWLRRQQPAQLPLPLRTAADGASAPVRRQEQDPDELDPSAAASVPRGLIAPFAPQSAAAAAGDQDRRQAAVDLVLSTATFQRRISRASDPAAYTATLRRIVAAGVVAYAASYPTLDAHQLASVVCADMATGPQQQPMTDGPVAAVATVARPELDPLPDQPPTTADEWAAAAAALRRVRSDLHPAPPTDMTATQQPPVP